MTESAKPQTLSQSLPSNTEMLPPGHAERINITTLLGLFADALIS